MNELLFGLMSLEYKFKSLFSPPEKVLNEVGIRKGSIVVDYGCGPGRYTIPIARMVGKEGRVYAIDIHPLAIKMVYRLAQKYDLPWIKTISANNLKMVPDSSADVVILYDTLHDIDMKKTAIGEIGRMLRPKGLLSARDHHIDRNELIVFICENDRFRLTGENKHTLTFNKTEGAGP